MLTVFNLSDSPCVKDLTGDMENVKNIWVCDKHYVSLTSEGTSLAC